LKIVGKNDITDTETYTEQEAQAACKIFLD